MESGGVVFIVSGFPNFVNVNPVGEFLEKNIFIFTLANPILYRLAALGLLKTTPRPANWVEVGRGLT